MPVLCSIQFLTYIIFPGSEMCIGSFYPVLYKTDMEGFFNYVQNKTLHF